MKTVKYVAAVAAILFTIQAAHAQDDLNRQVEVTKDFTPNIRSASKLGVTPNMVDTAALRPDFDYSIRPTAWVNGFGVEPIRPVRIDSGSYGAASPLYLKVGGGWPGQSLLDIYVNSKGRGADVIGFYGNHYGQYNDIMTDDGYKTNAVMTTNSAGLYGKKAFGRYILAGDLGYDHDVWTYYGRTEGSDPSNENHRSPMQHYSTPRAKLSFGNDFTDLSRFNFRISAEGYHISDRYDRVETGLKGTLELGKRFGDLHNVFLEGYADLYNGSKELNGSENTLIAVGPRYKLTAQGVTVAVGGKFAFETGNNDNDSWFLPEFSLVADPANGTFVPFIELTSELHGNSFHSLVRTSPYLHPDGAIQSKPTMEYKLRGGFSGTISSVFTYHVYGGGGIVNDMLVFAYYSPAGGDTFLPGFSILTEEKLKYFTVGAELGVSVGGFGITAAGHYYGYNTKTFDNPIWMPEFDASLAFKYVHSKRLFLRAGVELTGPRNALITEYSTDPFSYSENKYKADFNITAGVDYFINPKFGVFIEGNNLANRNLYRFAHYPGQGVSVSGGVKLKF